MRYNVVYCTFDEFLFRDKKTKKVVANEMCSEYL